MRKWLTWKQNERNNDVDTSIQGTQHFWLITKADNEDTMRWMETFVLHLGIRIIWLNDWNETEELIGQIIGIKITANNDYKLIAWSRLLLKILADFQFGVYLQSLVLNHATIHIRDRYV